jgi:hypothetical protein
MLDIDWSYLSYVNLWPVTHFKAMSFIPVTVEKVRDADSDAAFVQSYPNPFTPTTRIVFSFGRNASVLKSTRPRIAVYDVRGRRVADLTPGTVVSGQVYRTEWGCADAAGRQAASQVFIVRLIAGKQVIQKKLILLR